MINVPDFLENSCLKGHNDRRALHRSRPLTWDTTLVQHAQVWADHIAATGIIKHDPNRDGEGENIAWFKGHDAADCTDALMGWYVIHKLFIVWYHLNKQTVRLLYGFDR